MDSMVPATTKKGRRRNNKLSGAQRHTNWVNKKKACVEGLGFPEQPKWKYLHPKDIERSNRFHRQWSERLKASKAAHEAEMAAKEAAAREAAEAAAAAEAMPMEKQTKSPAGPTASSQPI